MNAYLRRIADSSLPRFLVVGALGELLYLGLYALGWRLTGQVTTAILLAGGLCLLVNAILHCRVSFRVPFRSGLLLRYGMIQAFCLAVTVLMSQGLQRLGMGATGVGLSSLVIWSGCSFLLTRATFRPSSRRDGPPGTPAPDRPGAEGTPAPDRPGSPAGLRPRRGPAGSGAPPRPRAGWRTGP